VERALTRLLLGQARGAGARAFEGHPAPVRAAPAPRVERPRAGARDGQTQRRGGDGLGAVMAGVAWATRTRGAHVEDEGPGREAIGRRAGRAVRAAARRVTGRNRVLGGVGRAVYDPHDVDLLGCFARRAWCGGRGLLRSSHAKPRLNALGRSPSAFLMRRH
jgi:hypothetical protein